MYCSCKQSESDSRHHLEQLTLAFNSGSAGPKASLGQCTHTHVHAHKYACIVKNSKINLQIIKFKFTLFEQSTRICGDFLLKLRWGLFLSTANHCLIHYNAFLVFPSLITMSRNSKAQFLISHRLNIWFYFSKLK